MSALENPRHEEFAFLLSKGVKQGAAYQQSGYQTNPGAASRLAQSPEVVARVTELKQQVVTKIKEAMLVAGEQDWQTLDEMGLTIPWVANQYREIYEQSMRGGAFAPAVAAVQNIQKLIESERASNPDDPSKSETKINMADMLSVLDKVSDIVKNAVNTQEAAPVLIDITPLEPNYDNI
jgi:hypothetical protein